MEKREVFKDPELADDLIISRYLDLPKFIDLLRTNELHLEPAVNFDDRLEGTLPESIREDMRSHLDKNKYDKSIEELEFERKVRTNLSCWTIGPEDNMALWKIYGGSSQSVAISTTVRHLITAAFEWCSEGRVQIKKVRYINHAGELPEGVYSLDEHIFGFKHIAYSYEREVRVILTRPYGALKKSLRLPIVFNDFAMKITVSPEAGEWFYNLVTDISLKYSVTVPVRKSELVYLIEKAKK
ncbi:MAG: hypothetical protein JRJ42_11005 [Deltaproteobacteria bacterium]|nr:hypothetical protein [Deltaproteobacteria bacterium]